MSTAQLSRLLPLPEDELKQVLDYATTLSKPEAADHLRNLLGDSPEAVDFIASFNSRRQDPGGNAAMQSSSLGRPPPSDVGPVPKSTNAPRKKKRTDLHTPAPRQVADFGLASGTTYNKTTQENDYISRRPSPAAPSSGRVSPTGTPPQTSVVPPTSKPPPSAAGRLISDFQRPKQKSNPSCRSSTPAPKTKVNISGGTPMRGASTALTDLDNAIRTLEIAAGPRQSGDDAARRCNCIATRHPLLAAAPNCLKCGKVICAKEGLGPCTFCGEPLLTAVEIESMINELKSERGREKMAADREVHKRAEVSKTPAPFSKPREGPASTNEAGAKALEHRDRLLGFQAQNARRTTIRDEAADFNVGGAMSGAGVNIWTSPEERARELKRQQKILRDMEWNARPEYERRRQIVSIDLVGGKVIKKMSAIERPESPDEEAEIADDPFLKEASPNRRENGSGKFSRNPLLGALIKPVFDAKGKGTALAGRKDAATRWRRVQDNLDDNEAVILDGGIYGGESHSQISATDEPARG